LTGLGPGFEIVNPTALQVQAQRTSIDVFVDADSGDCERKGEEDTEQEAAIQQEQHHVNSTR